MMERTPTVRAMFVMTPRPHCRPELMHRVLAEARAAATDRHLLERFIDHRDENAFGTILDRHGPMLLGLCRRQLHGSDLADDVLQATFLVLARKARSVRRRDNLAGWLYGVARRLVRDAQRSEAARQKREHLAARAEASPEPGWDELLSVLDEELQRLPGRFREPLLLCYLEGRTQDEAAIHLGWSVSTLRRRLERGRELLRLRMVRRGATLGAGLFASVVAPSAVRAVVTGELRRAVLAIAASPLRAGAIAPAVLMLANGELRMAVLTKCLFGSVLALSLAVVLAASAWSTGDAPRAAPQAAALDPPPALAPAPEPQLKAPAPGRDLWGDPLPRGAVARLGTIELQHGPRGSGVVFAPDGKYLVSLGGGWIRRWDLANRQATASVGKDWSVGYTMSRELVGGDAKLGTICRFVDVPGGVDFACTEYDLATGKAFREYHLAMDGVTSRATAPPLMSPDGKLLAGMYREIRLWRTSDGSLAREFPLPEGRFTTMVFTADSRTIFAGDDVHTIHVFDLAAGKELRTFGIPNVNGVACLAVTPDGKRLATRGGGDSFIRLWDTVTGTVERTLDLPQSGAAFRLCFTPDGRTLLASIEEEQTPGRRAIRTWDAASGEPGRAWTADPSIGMVFALSADGKLLATMNDAGVIRLWDMDTGQERNRPSVSPSGLVAVAFAGDGKTVYTVGDDFQLREWDSLGRQLRVPRPLVHRGLATFAPGGRLLVSGQTAEGVHMVRVEDLATGQILAETIGDEGVLSPDGKLLASSGEQMGTHIVDVPDGNRRRGLRTTREAEEAKGLRPKVRGFTADSRSVIVQGDVVSVFDVATGKERSSWSLYRNKVLDQPEDRVPKAKWKGAGPGGKGGGPGTWPSARGSERHLNAVAISPDGSMIAFAVDWLRNPGLAGGQYVRLGRLIVLETMTGKRLQDSELDDGQMFISHLAFSRDGKFVAAGGIGTVHVWQVGSDRQSWRFAGHLGRVSALAFSPDNRHLASASDDSTVLVWELGQ
jgi:RNA polymerase sigma factor (sigma-70 family)